MKKANLVHNPIILYKAIRLTHWHGVSFLRSHKQALGLIFAHAHAHRVGCWQANRKAKERTVKTIYGLRNKGKFAKQHFKQTNTHTHTSKQANGIATKQEKKKTAQEK